jgi:hypothetical protein
MYQPLGVKRYDSKPGVFISAKAIAAGFNSNARSTKRGPNGFPRDNQISSVPANNVSKMA